MSDMDKPITCDADVRGTADIPLAKKLKKYIKPKRVKYKKEYTDDNFGKINMRAHRVWWMISMFLCSLLYLFPEVIFNVSLVEVAGGKTSSEEDLRHIELFGRAISGVGVTLLIIDAWFTEKRFKGLKSALMISCGILILVWPVVFFGQKILVDKLIIEPSDAEARQEAFVLQVARKALVLNTIQIEGVDYDPNAMLNPEDKAFLALFPGVAWAEGSLIDRLNGQQESILRKFIKDEAYKNFDDYYDAYKKLRAEVKSKYSEYSDKSKEYNDAMNSWSKESDKHWLTIENELQTGWSKYQKSTKAFNARIEARAQDIAPKMYQFFESRNKCSEKGGKWKRRCYDKHQERYDRDIRKYNVGYIPANDFLIRQKVSTTENVMSSLVLGVLTGGLSVLAQGVDAATGGDGGFIDYKFKYTNNVDHYKNVLSVKMAPDFVKESGGYELGISNFGDFKRHPKTTHELKSTLSRKGLKMASGWNAYDRGGFDRSVKKKVQNEVKAQWKNKIGEMGYDLPPNLSWISFQKTKPVQQSILDKMGKNYVSPVMASWNNKQFMRFVVEPNIDRKTEEYLRILRSQVNHFKDSGKYEDVGKSALRATVIPPISMAISLFLVLLTALKLPVKLADIAGEIIKKQRYETKGWIPIALKAGYSITCLILIVSLPAIVGGNKFNEEDSVISFYAQKIKDSGNIPIGLSIDWVMATQPVIKPLGDTLESQIGIVESFKNHSHKLDDLDTKILTMLGSSGH